MSDASRHELTIHMFVRAAGLEPLDAEYHVEFAAPFGPAPDQLSLDVLLRYLDVFHENVKFDFTDTFEKLAEPK